MKVLRIARRNAEHIVECVYLYVAFISMLQAMGSYIPSWLHRFVGSTQIFGRNTIVDSYEVLEKMWKGRFIDGQSLIGLLAPEMWYIDLFLGFTVYILVVSPIIRFRREQKPRLMMLSGLALAMIFVIANKVPNDVGIVLGAGYVILNVVLLVRSTILLCRETKVASSEVQILGCGQHGVASEDSHVIDLSERAPIFAEKSAE
jgi:hypothetical protein